MFVAFGIQHATATPHIVICDLSGSTISFTLSDKLHDFLKNVIEHKIYVVIFSTTFV